MKKLLKLLALMATAAVIFTACPKGTDTPVSEPEAKPPVENPTDNPTDDPTEVVLYEKAAADYVNCGLLADLTGKEGTLVFTFENTSGAGRDGWGVGQIGVASNKDDCYNTTASTKVEATFVGSETTCTQEVAIADLPVADYPYLTANMWNGCVIIKIVLK